VRHTAPGVRAVRGTKISSSDPPLAAVYTADSTEPLQPVLHPPIELASMRPRGSLQLDRRIDFAAIRFFVLTRIKIFGGHVSAYRTQLRFAIPLVQVRYEAVRTGGEA
jgi:hypothetical protein